MNEAKARVHANALATASSSLRTQFLSISIPDIDKVDDLVAQMKKDLAELEKAICSHPAMAAGKCAICQSTYDEIEKNG